MIRASSVERLRARVSKICLALPEVRGSGDHHTAFRVRGKTFAYFLVDHHGDGRVALCCKAARGLQSELVASDPARFFVPPYLGPKGWIGFDFGTGAVDWDEVAELVAESYRLIGPIRLAALAGSDSPGMRPTLPDAAVRRPAARARSRGAG